MKKLMPLIFGLAAVVLLFLYFKKTSVHIGLSKDEVLNIIDPDYKFYDQYGGLPDTVILLMPNSWFGGNPEQKKILIFTSDTLYKITTDRTL